MNRKSKLNKLIDESVKLISESNRLDLLPHLEKYKAILNESKIDVMVCGEFKRGKSSLINALLQEDICAVDVDIATSLLTRISFSDELYAKRLYGDVGELQEQDIEDYSDSLKIQKDLEKTNTWMLNIGIKNEMLKTGVSIIDSPGIGGINEMHDYLTSFYVPKADIILFIMDASEPLSKSELDFLRDKIASTKEFIIVINKADLCMDIDEMVEDTKSKIIESIGEEYRDIPIVPVSTLLMNEYIEGKDKIDLEESNFSELNKHIANTMNVYQKKVIDVVKEGIIELLDSLREPLDTEIRVNEDNSILMELKQKLDKEKSNINELIQSASNWEVELGMHISQLRSETINQLDKKIIDLRNESIQDIIDNADNDIERLAELITQEIVEVSLNIEEFITTEILRIYNNISPKVILDKEDIELKGVDLDINIKKKEIETKEDNLSVILSGDFARSTLVVMGLMKIPVVGWALAGYTAFDTIVKLKERNSRENKLRIQKAFNGDIQKALINLKRYTKEVLINSEKVVRNQIKSEIITLKSNYMEIKQVYDNYNNKIISDNKERVDNINRKVQSIDQMSKYVSRV